MVKPVYIWRMNHPRWILPTIVFSQFCCTSLWFAGNGVMNDLVQDFGLEANAIGHLTSAVQVGFIIGTLLFAVLTLTDRFSPARVFLVCAGFGALFNSLIIVEGNTLTSILGCRLLTGFFLAGIYPVGMKIAADYYEKGLGKSLGFLVGALVVGTAFPHLLKGLTGTISWRLVLTTTSALAVLGGLLMVALVPDGPYRKPGSTVDFAACFSVFKKREFRAAAFGYFGHMWELYAFWAFVPIMLVTYQEAHPSVALNIPLLSFIIIAIGGPACVVSGYVSLARGPRPTALVALQLSGLCCLLSPLVLSTASSGVFVFFLMVWGTVVIADSPLFSTLVAQQAPVASRGTALTIVNGIGFSVTIVSIQLINEMRETVGPYYVYLLLALGPMAGWRALYQRTRQTPSAV